MYATQDAKMKSEARRQSGQVRDGSDACLPDKQEVNSSSRADVN